MDPNEAWIGKVLFAGLVGLALWGLDSLFRSKSEIARRARLVFGGVLALAVAWVIFMVAGPIGFVAVLAVIGAGVWIARGKTK